MPIEPKDGLLVCRESFPAEKRFCLISIFLITLCFSWHATVQCGHRCTVLAGLSLPLSLGLATSRIEDFIIFG